MPWRHRRNFRAARRRPTYRRRYGVRVGAPLTRTKWTRRKRVQQNLTRSVYWFKNVITIQSNLNGNFRSVFSPGDVVGASDWLNFGTIFNEFKVLKMIVKFFPASVGSESLQEANAPASVPGREATFKRGDVITWVDQGVPVVPGAITDIINKSSAMLVQPRRFHKRYVNRARGYPTWGALNDNGSIAIQDPWDSKIQIFGENFTPIQSPGTQIWYYCQIMWKVLFRGRQEG